MLENGNGLYTTPFGGNSDYVYMPKAKDGAVYRNCSPSMIENLIKSRIFGGIEENIINIIYEYRILSYASIATLLNSQNGNYKKKDDYSSNLGLLRSYGVIGLYKNQEGQGVYILSDGAILYCDNKGGNKSKKFTTELEETLSAERVNHVVSINRLHIEADGSAEIRVKKYDIRNDLYRFFEVERDRIRLPIAAVSIRRGDDYEKLYYGCSTKMANVFPGRKPFVLLLCEDRKHIIEVASKLIGTKNISLESVMFSDDNSCQKNAFENMFICENINGVVKASSFSLSSSRVIPV